MKKAISILTSLVLSSALLTPTLAAANESDNGYDAISAMYNADSSETTQASGTWKSNVTWSIEDGTLTISGSGAVMGYELKSGPTPRPPWWEYEYSRLVIEEGITSIGTSAFCNSDELVLISLPDSLKVIGISAFGGCDALETITIPGSIETVGQYAFSGCTNLVSIDICSGVKTISKNAFSDCRSLTDISIPETVTEIAESAFYNCDSLTEAHIPEGVEVLGAYAFGGCDSLTAAYIPSTLTRIDRDVLFDIGSPFAGSSSLEAIEVAEDNECYCSVDGVMFSKSMNTIVAYPAAKGTSYVIPDGVRNIGVGAFMECDKLGSVTMPESVSHIYDAAFQGCSSLESLDISNVTYIGKYAFYGCSRLEAELPKGLKYLGSWSFAGTAIRSAVIPDGITAIGRLAFLSCDRLESITIPVSVKSIEPYAADNCASLTDVYYEGTQEEWENINIDDPNEWLIAPKLHFMPKSDIEMTYAGGEVMLSGTTAIPANTTLIKTEYDSSGRFTGATTYPVTKLTAPIQTGEGDKFMLWRSMSGIMPMTAVVDTQFLNK